MKLCVNCKYHVPSINSTQESNFDHCLRTSQQSPVTGEFRKPSYCEVERGSEYLCGLSAKHFERKPITEAA